MATNKSQKTSPGCIAINAYWVFTVVVMAFLKLAVPLPGVPWWFIFVPLFVLLVLFVIAILVIAALSD